MIFAQHDARPDASPVVSQTSRLPAAANPANVALLLLLCAVFMWLRWKKLDELLWGDPVHWLHEASRVARGELPYRDASYLYLPLALLYFRRDEIPIRNKKPRQAGHRNTSTRNASRRRP